MTRSRWDVRLLRDDATILELLEQDRRWAAYALCDVDRPYRDRARFIGALRVGRAEALVLLYRLQWLPGAHALLVFGDPEAARAIFARYRRFPERAFIIIRSEYLSPLEERYSVQESWAVLRMVLDATDARPASDVDAPIVRLTSADIPALRALYRHWNTSFDPLMLESGVYCGVYEGRGLIAVAGTHAVSTRRGIAAIGGVFTHPDHRGRGLATGTTGAVVEEVLRQGVDLVVLNVREDNAPAIAAYRRLGFMPYHSYLEGHALRRT
jgi:ribosomal protein S18 acetylase RimI-like enzyme